MGGGYSPTEAPFRKRQGGWGFLLGGGLGVGVVGLVLVWVGGGWFFWLGGGGWVFFFRFIPTKEWGDSFSTRSTLPAPPHPRNTHKQVVIPSFRSGPKVTLRLYEKENRQEGTFPF